ncbi:MAG: hypothetical protein JXA06_12570 [Bacteroidetes bacterium]|nr:hypothetical protein [Bacteroidota bacterium]
MLQISYATDTTSVASGGNARMLALGGSPVNHYIEDYTDIFINPAYMERYPRLAMIELGNGFGSGSGYSANNQNLGITCPLGKTTLGLAIGKREGPMFAENSYGYQNGGAFTACDYMKYALDIYLQNIAVQASSEPLTPIQLLGAFKLENGSAGVALYYANWSRDDNGTGSVSSGRTCSASLSQYGIKLGFLHTLDSCTVLDLSGCFRLNKASVDYSNRNAGAPLTASSFSANGYEMLATIRFFYKLADGISLIPLARAGVFSYEPEISSSPLSNYLLPLPNSYWNLECELGLGIQSLWEHGLGAVGVSFRYISLKNDAVSSTGSAQQTTQYKRTWLDLPKINAGIELYITDWLAGRAGFSKRISSQSTYVESSSSPPTESTITTEPGFLPSYGLNAADQTLSLGLGIVLDKFAFNAYLAEQVLGTGSYLLSGIEQSLFGLVSISYQY